MAYQLSLASLSAKGVPPAGKVLLGMHGDVTQMTTIAGRNPDVVPYYWSGGSVGIGDTGKAAIGKYIPRLDWNANRLNATSPTGKVWADIAAGRMNTAVDLQVDSLKWYGDANWLCFFTFVHEMNTSGWNNGAQGTAADFVAAWRYVWNRAKSRLTAKQFAAVLWYLNPGSTAMMGTINSARSGSVQTGGVVGFYPGDAYVDWLGPDPYNWYQAHRTSWQTFTQVMASWRTWYLSNFPNHERPVMVAETATLEGIAPLDAQVDFTRKLRDYGMPGNPGYPWFKGVIWFGTYPILGDSYAYWKASTSYNTGAFVNPNPANGFRYKCTVAGKSASAQPNWPTVIDATVTDGTVTWKCWTPDHVDWRVYPQGTNPQKYAGWGEYNVTASPVFDNSGGAAPSDTTPPTAPTLAVPTSPAAGQVALSWTAATDASGIKLYTVARDGVDIATSTTLTYTDTGLPPGTYQYVVTATDNAGNVGPASASQQISIAGVTPPPPPPPVDSPVDLMTIGYIVP